MDTAVLVIDMQNGFIHGQGSLPRAGRIVPRLPEVIKEQRALLDTARGAALPVIYTRMSYRPGYPEMPDRMRERLLPLVTQHLISGTWDADVIDDLVPREGDVIIEKSRYDAFLYTDLDLVLRGLGVSRVLVTGIVTHACVESTVRAGYMRGYQMYVASDCVSGRDEFHQPALDVMADLFCHEVAPWQEVLPGLLAGPA